MSNLTKFVIALVGLVALLLVASRQLFLSVVMRDASGLRILGGTSHLWLAGIAVIAACVAGGLMTYFFMRHEKKIWSKVEMTPLGHLNPMALNPPKSPPAVPFDARRWRLLIHSW